MVQGAAAEPAFSAGSRANAAAMKFMNTRARLGNSRFAA
jgi:hypothetical protein